MSEASRVGQRFPIRKHLSQTSSISSTVPDNDENPSERTLRYLRRAESRALSETPADMTTTVTTVERHLTSTHERDMRASADPEHPVVPPSSPGSEARNPQAPSGPPGDDDPGDSPGGTPGGGPPDDDPNPGDDQSADSDSNDEITNSELRKVLLQVLSTKSRKKTPFKPKEPDLFSGSSPQALRTFIFQCQIYFDAKKSEFTEDSDRIYFAISYLRGPALEYFEPFIISPSKSRAKTYDFLTKWDTFVQKLTNQFGSYSPEDDDEDALTSIPFPDDGKATRYFIEFAKYESRVDWDDRALRKVIKDAIPTRISDELKYSREDTSTFEGFKKAVMKIDNDYWKKKQDDANKRRMMQALQTRFGKSVPKPDPKKFSGPPRPPMHPSQPSSSQQPSSSNNKSRPKPNNFRPNISKPYTPPVASSSSSSSFVPRTDHLGPDGKLTATEKQRRIDRGLCLLCGQKGHLVRECPRSNRTPPSNPPNNAPKARAVKAEPEAEASARPKN
jgi:Domain of unknown function (DUF4939)